MRAYSVRSKVSFVRKPCVEAIAFPIRGSTRPQRTPAIASAGHSSIQITVDTYGHLIPGADIAWVDRLDAKTAPHQDAPGTHQQEGQEKQENLEVVETTWLPPRDSNPDMLIQSQLSCR